MANYFKSLFVVVFLLLSVNTSFAQDVAVYDADKLMQRLAAGTDTVFVVGFWATWCGPCVKEIPEFAVLADKYKGRPVKILLVSMDFKEDYQRKLQKFINKKNIEHEVVWLNESNANEFIPKINNEWQGSIPATLLFYKKKNYQKFIEGAIKSSQLSVLIDKQLVSRY